MSEISNSRLVSVDIFRGLFVAIIVTINNPGNWAMVFPWWGHAKWHGLGMGDIPVPCFLFIIGITTFISLNKRRHDLSAALKKVARRSVLLFIIGFLLGWFGLTLTRICEGDSLLYALFPIDGIRLMGVFQRFAISYLATATIALYVPRKAIKYITCGLLVVYSAILVIGNGLEFSERNILYIVDAAIIGPQHMCMDYVNNHTMPFDPEGILSTIPSIAQCLTGYLCGSYIFGGDSLEHKPRKLLLAGLAMLIIGLTLSFIIPVNKKIWSPSFVLVTCGCCIAILSVLVWYIDVRGHKDSMKFFHIFGSNPLFIYLLATILTIVMHRIFILDAEGNSIDLYTLCLHNVFVPMFGNHYFPAMLFLAPCIFTALWLLSYYLYKRKIFIKI